MSASDKFRGVADRIDKNTDDDVFGGAICIVPPGDGESVELVIFDKRKDAAQFWSLVKTRAEVALNELIDKDKQMRNFGRVM